MQGFADHGRVCAQAGERGDQDIDGSATPVRCFHSSVISNRSRSRSSPRIRPAASGQAGQARTGSALRSPCVLADEIGQWRTIALLCLVCSFTVTYLVVWPAVKVEFKKLWQQQEAARTGRIGLIASESTRLAEADVKLSGSRVCSELNPFYTNCSLLTCGIRTN